MEQASKDRATGWHGSGVATTRRISFQRAHEIALAAARAQENARAEARQAEARFWQALETPEG